MLPLNLRRRARSLAQRMGVSLSALIRESLEASLRGDRGDLAEDPLYDDEIYDGPAPDDLSSDHDAYLYGADRDEPSS